MCLYWSNFKRNILCAWNLKLPFVRIGLRKDYAWFGHISICHLRVEKIKSFLRKEKVLVLIFTEEKIDKDFSFLFWQKINSVFLFSFLENVKEKTLAKIWKQNAFHLKRINKVRYDVWIEYTYISMYVYAWMWVCVRVDYSAFGFS